ncbi:MAG: helicase C-terminal domain-containing protein [Candidatus Dormibacteria bacterium]
MTAPIPGARPLRRPSQARGRVGDHWTVQNAEGQPSGAVVDDFPVIVSLDLEATGLSASVDHVIEIGAVKFRGHEVLGRYHTLVNPGVRLPPMIRRLTGINDQDLARAPRLRGILPDLKEFIGDANLLAHGAGYDITFLETTLGGGALGGRDVFDTIEVARVVAPSAPSYSLGGLCELVNLQHPRAHHALEDAEATFRVFLALADLAARLPAATLDRLRELTATTTHSLRSFFHDIVVPLDAGAPARPRAVPLAAPAVHAEMPRLEVEDMVRLLGADGPLAAEPGWELREAQLDMCRAVSQALERRLNLVVEAGTGTGKSLAYLLPALGHAASRGKQVYVSTYTINLQEQLLHKDLPLAARILGIPLRAVLLKGRGHYLSRLRWGQLLLGTAGGRDAPDETLDGINPDELLIFKLKITVWLDRTLSGDRDELRLFGQEERCWRAVASEWGDCTSSACLAGPSPCFYHLSRKRATDADVVVVNHALLLADAFNERESLASVRCLVLDEAHHLEEAATRGLTEEVREDDILQALSLAAGAAPRGPGPGNELGQLAQTVSGLFEAIRMAARTIWGLETGRELTLDEASWEQPWMAAIQAQAELSRDAVRRLPAPQSALVAPRMARLLEMLTPGRHGRVVWFSFGRDGRTAVRAAPVDVATALRDAVFEDRDTVVLTSATLTVEGGFEYFQERIGLPASRVVELILPSPFDFLEQALLCLPDDVPSPGDEGFEDALVDVISDAALRLRGRTLVLFTSTEQLNQVSGRVRDRLMPEGIEVLAQGRGSGSRRALTERFASMPEAVLCGTNSFWEGLDLPGRSLSCVVIVRLPFSPPSDPVFRARSEHLRDPFLQLALPEAVLRLKQGFGRLIRRATDRGAVVIFDRRVSTRSYGAHFLASLPQCSSFTGPAGEIGDAIEEWVSDRRISFTDGEYAGIEPAAPPGAGPMRSAARGPGGEPQASPRAR